ncbi:MAG: hypothetical protein K5776_07540, partial [Lachnospiraceae bacterium]|nr:hypothetical protein [Lachnospiraceae bacterium]
GESRGGVFGVQANNARHKETLIKDNNFFFIFPSLSLIPINSGISVFSFQTGYALKEALFFHCKSTDILA